MHLTSLLITSPKAIGHFITAGAASKAENCHVVMLNRLYRRHYLLVVWRSLCPTFKRKPPPPFQTDCDKTQLELCYDLNWMNFESYLEQILILFYTFCANDEKEENKKDKSVGFSKYWATTKTCFEFTHFNSLALVPHWHVYLSPFGKKNFIITHMGKHKAQSNFNDEVDIVAKPEGSHSAEMWNLKPWKVKTSASAVPSALENIASTDKFIQQLLRFPLVSDF